MRKTKQQIKTVPTQRSLQRNNATVNTKDNMIMSFNLIENIADGFFSLDRNWNFIYVNRFAAKLFKRKAKELIGKSFWSEFPNAEEMEYARHYKIAMKTRKVTMCDFFSPELQKWFQIRIYPHENGISIFYFDATELKRREYDIQFYERTIHSLSEAVITTDNKYNILSWNAAAEKLYGVKEKDVIGKSAQHVMTTKFMSSSREDWQKSMEKDGYWRGEVTQKQKDGTYIDLLSTTSVVTDSQGKTIGAVAINRDISDRKRYEEQLQFQADILKNVRDSVIVTNLEGKIIFWNDGATALFGYTENEMLGKSLISLYDPIQKKQVKNDLQSIMQGTEYVGEWKGRRKDKSSIWVDVKTTLLKSSTGEAKGFIGVARDITERKKIEENLQFLASAKTILASSLDYKSTLYRVARSAVPYVADWCGVDLLDTDGALHQLAVVHKDPKKIKYAYQLRNEYPVDMSSKTGMANVLKTGKVEYYPLITDEMISAIAKDKHHADLMRKIGLISIIIAPIIVHKKPLGTITFVSAESKRSFTKADLQMIEQLASRASLAIENAMLYQDVKKERERLVNMVANVPGIVWEAWGKPDTSGQRIDFVSNHVRKMLGYSVEEWLKTPNFWLTIVHPEDKERAAKEAATIYTSGKIGISRFRWIRKDGKSIWVEAQSFVIKDTQGEPIGMRGVTMDISERMEIEKRKDEFISMASHELKTPITSIKVFTQILERDFSEKGEKKSLRYLKRMDEQIDKLTNLVSELLDVSKIQAGKLELKYERFHLKKLITETAENIQETTKEHIIQFNAIDNVEVFADINRVNQVIVNLLTNAIKYSPKKHKILITIHQKDKYAIVSVRDYGVGIAKEHQRKIFERFYRVYDHQDMTFPGLGMGLYISNEIVKRHGGEMWLESEKGHGSTFYFSLPMK